MNFKRFKMKLQNCWIILLLLFSCSSEVQTKKKRQMTASKVESIDSSKIDSPSNPKSDDIVDGKNDINEPNEPNENPNTSASKPTNPPSNNQFVLADPIAHKTDFLAGGCLTHLYAGFGDGERAECRQAMIRNGYTHIYVYIYNEKDYETIYPKGALSFNFYDKPDQFVIYLKELLADRLTPVVWLIPDDASKMRSTPVNIIKGYFSNVIATIDPYVGSYVLGLELDEYWTDTQVKPLGAHLNTLTEKKIGIHLTSRDSPTLRFMNNDWADYIVFQYGFNKSASEIASITSQMVSKLNTSYNKKPLVAGEYNINRDSRGILLYTKDSEQRGISIGDAAVAAGAVGFGNGGTNG